MKKTPNRSRRVTHIGSHRGAALLLWSYVAAYVLLALSLASMTQTTVGLHAATQTVGVAQALSNAEGNLDSDLAAIKQYGYDFAKGCVSPKCAVINQSPQGVPQVFSDNTVELQFSELGTSLNAPSSQESVQAIVKSDTKSTSFLYDLYATGPGSYIQISGGGGTKGTGSTSLKTLITPPGDVAFSGPPTSTELGGTSVELSQAKINGTFYGDAKALTVSKDSYVSGGVKPLKDADKSDALPEFTPPVNCDTTKKFDLNEGGQLVLKPGVYCTDHIKLDAATLKTNGTGRVTVFVVGGSDEDGSGDVNIEGSTLRGISLDQQGREVVDPRQLVVFVKGDVEAKGRGTKVGAAVYAQGKVTISKAGEFIGAVIANRIKVDGTTVTYYTDLAQVSYPLGPADTTLKAWNASTSAAGSGHSSQ